MRKRLDAIDIVEKPTGPVDLLRSSHETLWEAL
jgi:hypothetical protein